MGLVIKMSNLNQRKPSTTVLGSGQSFTLKDYRGFTVFEIDDKGNFKHKGTQVKL